ncbi:MAG: hypothetical protein Q8N69_01370 [bacterium]|nr:hypothetical protein [bacterium]
MGRLLKETPLSEILATLEVFDKHGVTREDFAKIRSHPDFGKKVSELIISGPALVSDDSLVDKTKFARSVLGDDVIFPLDIAAARNISYSEKQIQSLVKTFPSKDMLHWCKANNYALIASPPEPMSLLEVRSLKPELFYEQSGGWFAGQNFAKNDKTSFGWLAIRKDIVPDSTDKTWNKQFRLLTDEERVPNAGGFAWFITTYYEVRRVRLFKRIYARTSSVDSDGYYVVLGDCGERGLGVDSWDGVHCFGNVGLASARKF